MAASPQTDHSPTRSLTPAEVRAIISHRKSGQTINDIATGMNLLPSIILRVLRGEMYADVSAPIFAGMVFPGISMP